MSAHRRRPRSARSLRRSGSPDLWRAARGGARQRRSRPLCTARHSRCKTSNSRMKTRISTKGQIVLPAGFRRQDGVKSGQEFEIERLEQGEYLLKRTKGRRNLGLVQLLLDCPVKAWFHPAARVETTDDLPAPKRG